MGRARKYFSEEENKQAKNEYAKKYYAENPDYWKDRYDIEYNKKIREKNMKKGYYIIYNDELQLQYVSFFKNIQERQRIIRKRIVEQDTAQGKRFIPSDEWEWKMLFFCDEASPELLEKCVYKEKEYKHI
mgnify:FL=1